MSIPYFTFAPESTMIREEITERDANGQTVIVGYRERPTTRREREGIVRRQCTYEYKIRPINRAVRMLLGSPASAGPCRSGGRTVDRIFHRRDSAGQRPAREPLHPQTVPTARTRDVRQGRYLEREPVIEKKTSTEEQTTVTEVAGHTEFNPFPNEVGLPLRRGLFRSRVWRPALLRMGLLGEVTEMDDKFEAVWMDVDGAVFSEVFDEHERTVRHVVAHESGGLRFHDLRDFYGTLLADKGCRHTSRRRLWDMRRARRRCSSASAAKATTTRSAELRKAMRTATTVLLPCLAGLSARFYLRFWSFNRGRGNLCARQLFDIGHCPRAYSSGG